MRLILIVLSLLLSSGLTRGATAGETCEAKVEGGLRYTLCSFDPAESVIRIYHRNPAGQPFGSFDSLIRQLWNERHTLIAAMNGGMYHADLSAVGLFIEHGIERQAISTKGGWGNFHLLPNGVFWLEDGKAGVTETSRFTDRGLKPDYATQSGPMLVIDGEIHPRFLADSDSLKIRNGIGVDEKGRVHMLISEVPVRFYDFALLFRDGLGCRNALYLDGTISSLYAASTGRRDHLFPLGPIIAVIGTLP